MLLKKKCTRCKQLRDPNDFGSDRGRGDGLDCRCRQCCKVHNKERYEANPEKYRERERKRREADPKEYSKRQRRQRKSDPEKCREQQRRRREADPEKYREQQRKLREANPEKHRDYSREYMFLYNLKKKYGMTKAEYDDMLALQGGRCAICKKRFPGRPHIDHDHETNVVRGLLCACCNRGLGAFKDDPKAVEAALNYLRADS
jgi:hypothetical protein